ncbi:GL13717 [Drosophila persimilis]|uniref:GL13717 n=1 Tax=Drosophila persimilis TaxID=7234 RepID=B4GNV5_DROPE|nr:GL13717 [Drosophila persimilis]
MELKLYPELRGDDDAVDVDVVDSFDACPGPGFIAQQQDLVLGPWSLVPGSSRVRLRNVTYYQHDGSRITLRTLKDPQG